MPAHTFIVFLSFDGDDDYLIYGPLQNYDVAHAWGTKKAASYAEDNRPTVEVRTMLNWQDGKPRKRKARAPLGRAVNLINF